LCILLQSQEEVTGYIPQATWYDIWDGTMVDASSSGRNITFAAPMGHVPVHVQGGHVIPMQEPRMTTQDTWANPLTLLAALPSPGARILRKYCGIAKG
jgi:alpha-glucosidase (family GH31 glycosyl hydrolase)